MNLGQLKTMVSFFVDDLAYGYFTQSEITTYLNNAQKECQKLLLQAGENYYTLTYSTYLVSGQSSYSLPADFMDLNRLAVVTAGTGPTATQMPLSFITLNQRDLVSTQSGVPSYYTLVKNKLRIFPVPQSTQLLLLTYSPMVADMVSDSDIPDVPPFFHEFLAVLATIDCFLRDGRDMSAFLEKRKYYEGMLKNQAQDRHVDSPRQVVTTDSYNSGGDYFY